MADLIDGATVKMEGREYVIPALSFGQLKKFLPILQSLQNLGGIPAEEDMDKIKSIVHAALSRNYPDMGIERMDDLLDLRNAATVIQAVMGQSGLVAGEPKGNR